MISIKFPKETQSITELDTTDLTIIDVSECSQEVVSIVKEQYKESDVQINAPKPKVITIIMNDQYVDEDLISLKAQTDIPTSTPINWSFRALTTKDGIFNYTMLDNAIKLNRHFEGTIKVTATCGELTDEKTITLTCNEIGVPTGVYVKGTQEYYETKQPYNTTSHTYWYEIGQQYKYPLKGTVVKNERKYRTFDFEPNQNPNWLYRYDRFEDHGAIYLFSVELEPAPFKYSKIEYTATSKITPRTNNLPPISSHEFNNGKGTISFITEITSVGDSAFTSCYDLTSITLPYSVRTIGVSAFMDCSNLKTVNLDSGITSIGNNAFAQCYRLNKINYTGQDSMWKRITKGNDLFDMCPQKIYLEHETGVIQINP